MRPSRFPLLVLLLAMTILPGQGDPTTAQSISTPVGASRSVAHDNDVPYGKADGAALLLDVYRPPARDAPRPAVIVIHSGGLVGGSKYDAAAIGESLAEAGYVTFAIDYRLFLPPKTFPWPDQLDDAQRAVRWIRANAEQYGVDPRRVCALGFSAGGQLAALLGTEETRDNADPALAGYSSRVSCVADISGIADVTDPSIALLDYSTILGESLEDRPEVFRDASPLFQVDAQTVPILVIHGAVDTIVPVEQARRLVDTLHNAGVDVVYAEYSKGDHFIEISWDNIAPLVLGFLDLQLHPAR